MKKIIEGKLYNTETAKMIGEGGNGRGRNDFSYYEEELYIKRTGEYFLYGCGGAMSRYAESCGQNTWTGGESIIPMTEKEAREWAEENIYADDYMEIFGEVEE